MKLNWALIRFVIAQITERIYIFVSQITLKTQNAKNQFYTFYCMVNFKPVWLKIRNYQQRKMIFSLLVQMVGFAVRYLSIRSRQYLKAPACGSMCGS